MHAISFANFKNFYHQVTEFVCPLSSLISYLAKRIFFLGCFAALVNNSPYFGLPIGFLVGLSSPEFVMEKTSRIYASIWSPKELKIKNQGNNIPAICVDIMKRFHSCEPAILAGTIAFFALPVSAFPILTTLVSLRFGAYIGMRADTDTYANQWLYKEKKVIA